MYMDKIKQAIADKLNNQGLELEDSDLDYLVNRFGLTDVEQVDDDFIKIVIGMASQPDEKTTTGTHSDKQNIPKLRDNTEKLTALMEQKIEIEAAKIAQIYKDAPKRVKELVLKDLEGLIDNEKPQKNFANLRNIVDFSVVFLTDTTHSRYMVHQTFFGLFILAILLIGSVFIYESPRGETHHQKIQSTGY